MSTPTDELTDAQVDQLIERIAQRIQATALPLVNEAGLEVPTQYATTGRLQVAAGQQIASVWGNLLWDQSTQHFDSATDRASQYPSPVDGALSYLADVGHLDLFKGGLWYTLFGLPSIYARSWNQMNGNWPSGNNGFLIPTPTPNWTYDAAHQTITFLTQGLFLIQTGLTINNTNVGSYQNFYFNPQASNSQYLKNFNNIGGAMRCVFTWIGIAAANATAELFVNLAGGPVSISQAGCIAYLGSTTP